MLHITSHVYAYCSGGFWKRRNITPPFWKDRAAHCCLYIGANVLPFLSKKGYRLDNRHRKVFFCLFFFFHKNRNPSPFWETLPVSPENIIASNCNVFILNYIRQPSLRGNKDITVCLLSPIWFWNQTIHIHVNNPQIFLFDDVHLRLQSYQDRPIIWIWSSITVKFRQTEIS